MAHVRKQIRDAIVTAVTGLVTTGTRVFASRIYPHDATAVPGLAVYTLVEASEDDTLTRPRSLERTLTVAVEGRAKAGSGIDDTLDAICLEVEQVLGNSTLGGLVKDLVLEGTEVALADELEKPVGIVRMRWQALYRTAENVPDVAQ